MNKIACCLSLAALCGHAIGQSSWTMDARSPAGPVAMVELPKESENSRLSMIAFEFARKCDPIFSYIEMKGRKFGAPEKQTRLPKTSIGSRVNGKHYTGVAVATIYSNGIEVGFGVPDEMAFAIAFDEIRSLSFITPAGKEISVTTKGFRSAVDAALNVCTSRVDTR